MIGQDKIQLNTKVSDVNVGHHLSMVKPLSSLLFCRGIKNGGCKTQLSEPNPAGDIPRFFLRKFFLQGKKRQPVTVHATEMSLDELAGCATGARANGKHIV